MNGPEHYREAERLLDSAVIRTGFPEDDYAADFPGEPVSAGPAAQEGNGNLAAALVHAMLAGVAATIETAAARAPGDVSQVWIEAPS